MINTLCFSSGGIKGFCFFGALKSLINNNYLNLKNINLFVGTSFGAIISCLLIINSTIDELYNLDDLEFDYDIDLFLNNYGFNDGKILINKLSNYLFKKFNVYDITFKDLYNLTDKKIIILGTNYTKCCETIFSVDETPNMSVIQSIRISTSIPLIFSPVLIDNEYYMDGALINNIGIHLCDPKTTLGFKINENNNNKLENIYDLIIGTVTILSEKNKLCLKNYNIININNINSNKNLTNIDIINKKKLFDHGYKQANIFLKNMYYNKINKIKKNK
jgi:NTE family protein